MRKFPFLEIMSGTTTALTLLGGLIIGFVAGMLLLERVAGQRMVNPDLVYVALFALVALTSFSAGAALWGVLIGGLAGISNHRRMAVAGLVGFAPITLLLMVSLGTLEPVIVQHFEQLPIHRVFTLMFVPNAFLASGVSAFAIGIGSGIKAIAPTLFWRVGLAGAAAFLAVNLTMESLGWVVGGPHAAERVTMLTVMSAGNIGAALVGGAVLGRALVGAVESSRGEIVIQRGS